MIITEKKENSLFSIHNPVGVKFFTRLRLQLSHLNEDKFRHKIQLVKISHLKVFCTKGVLRNFAKFSGKHLCQSLFFNKVAGLRPATLLKKRLWHRCFPVNFAKFLRTPFLTEYLR